MKSCVVTASGSGEDRSERGFPVPFYRYLIIASDLSRVGSVATIGQLFGHPPMPANAHYAGGSAGEHAAIEAAVRALREMPELRGLNFEVDEEV
jgi:hypothetical protein